jgi:hypothetical protein
VAAGTVAIRLDDADDSDDELRQLARWLRDEEELRGRVDLELAPIQQDHMGGMAQAVVVVLTSGTASALVTSLFNWLAHRRDVDKVTVSVEPGPTGKVEVTCGSPDDAERLLRACRDVLSSGE